MTHDDLDRLLGEPEEITPSSGFIESVMSAVRDEFSAPAPLPFPWKRAVPGLLAGIFAIVLVILAAVPFGLGAQRTPPISETELLAFCIRALHSDAGYATLAGIATLLSLKLSLRFASEQSGL